MSGASLFVIALVLAVALLHATYNVIVKGSADRPLALANLSHILAWCSLPSMYRRPARRGVSLLRLRSYTSSITASF
jgi:hypothetical protein